MKDTPNSFSKSFDNAAPGGVSSRPPGFLVRRLPFAVSSGRGNPCFAVSGINIRLDSGSWRFLGGK